MADIVYREFVELDRPNIYNNGNESVEVFRLKNDNNGNSRFVFHWLAFSREGEWYEDVVRRLNNTDNLPRVKKYRAKWYGGGIVFQPDNLKKELEDMWDATYNTP